MDLTHYFDLTYRWCGRDWDGVDCYGLLVLWFREELGIELFDPAHNMAHYTEIRETNLLLKHSGRDFVQIPFSAEPRRHDVLLVSSNSPVPNHCGVVLDKRTFLHIQERPGCNVSRISGWRPAIAGIYRHKDLCYEDKVSGEHPRP